MEKDIQLVECMKYLLLKKKEFEERPEFGQMIQYQRLNFHNMNNVPEGLIEFMREYKAISDGLANFHILPEYKEALRNLNNLDKSR